MHQFPGLISSSASDKGGRFVVGTAPFDLLAGLRRIQGSSSESWEAALRDLALAHAPEPPLDDPRGLFLRLRELRAGHVQHLFALRAVNLTDQDCDRLEALPGELSRLQAAARPRLEWGPLTTPAVFTLETFTQSMLHRVFAFLDGTAREWNVRNGAAAAALARAVLETVSVWHHGLTMALDYISSGKYREYDELLGRLIFGSKEFEKTPGYPKQVKPLGVLDAIKSLSDPAAVATYYALCEVAHPNGDSLRTVHAFEMNGTGSVEFDTTGFADHLLGAMLAALRLDVAERCLLLHASLVPLLEAAFRRPR